MKLQLLLSILPVLVSLSSAQAPGDENFPFCNSSGSTPTFHTYPLNYHLLIDSFNYANLITGVTPTPVWVTQTFSTAGMGWVRLGGQCRNGLHICNNPPDGSEEDWIFTQYISYQTTLLNTCAVTVQLDLSTLSCNGCPTSVQILRYDRNGVASASERIDRNNYNLVKEVSGASSTFTFLRPQNVDRFYIAIRSMGFCGTISRLQVYYDVRSGGSWPDSTGLLSCPDVGFPIDGCPDTLADICACGVNAARTSSSLDISCSTDRSCTGNPSCGCNPGYEFVSGTCTACPEGMYQPMISASNPCRSCPEQSNTFVEATAVCPCSFNFNRPDDEPDEPCTRPPTAPQISPDPPTIDGTFIVVCWRAVNNSGGRDDLHYNIYTLPAGGSIFSRANAEPIEPSGANQCYELSGLQSQTSYTIVVTSANGATNDPVEFEELSQVENRFIAFYVSTGEGGALRRSGAIALTFFLTLIFAAGIAVLVTALVVWFVLKPKWQNGSSHSQTTNGSSDIKSSNAYANNQPYAAKRHPPPRPPAAQKV